MDLCSGYEQILGRAAVPEFVQEAATPQVQGLHLLVSVDHGADIGVQLYMVREYIAHKCMRKGNSQVVVFDLAMQHNQILCQLVSWAWS